MNENNLDFIAFKFLKYASQLAEGLNDMSEIETEEEVDELNEALKNNIDILCDLKKELIKEEQNEQH